MLIPSSQLDLVEVDAPLRPYRNGKDLTDRPRNIYVIDCYGMGIDDVKTQYPKLYQWLLERVKPERDLQTDKTLREKWWLHRRNNDDLRFAIKGIQRYIATGQTAKHRVFQFLDGVILPDDKLIAIGLDDAFYLGVLASRVHTTWAFATGGWMGVGNDSVYNKGKCFDAFPFPLATAEQQAKIRPLAEQLDAHRKRQQAEHADLTLTGMYNILEKIRLGQILTDKEKTIHQKGLVSILRELHDDLDRAVFDAYGWSDLASKLVGKAGATTPYPNKPEDQAAAEEELLKRLVDLNTQRANDEANGIIHWLRPDYQNPSAISEQTQIQGELETTADDDATVKIKPAAKQTWPKEMRDQVSIVRQLVKDHPYRAEQMASFFKRNPLASVQSVLDALEGLGMVSAVDGIYRLT